MPGSPATTAIQELLRSRQVRRASTLGAARPAAARFRLAELAGRLVELTADAASAVLTVAVGLVREAQELGEPVAWIAGDAPFYPPDLEENGVELAALAVIQIAETGNARRRQRAAETLLRSGAFGLVVLDLGPLRALPLPAQTRLASLAQHHDAALLCLTERRDARTSLGSLVSLHAVATRRRLGDGRFVCELRALKDKRRGPGWIATEVCRGPAGLR
jgi:recombination protein RecA